MRLQYMSNYEAKLVYIYIYKKSEKQYEGWHLRVTPPLPILKDRLYVVYIQHCYCQS